MCVGVCGSGAARVGGAVQVMDHALASSLDVTTTNNNYNNNYDNDNDNNFDDDNSSAVRGDGRCGRARGTR